MGLFRRCTGDRCPWASNRPPAGCRNTSRSATVWFSRFGRPPTVCSRSCRSRRRRQMTLRKKGLRAGCTDDRTPHPLVDSKSAAGAARHTRAHCMGDVVCAHHALDAIPDLSDVQVIVRTTYPGQAPQIVEDQVTYPLTTTMMSVPGAKTVRGYSFFGDSFVYVLFEDGTDLYWARSRVLEYLDQVQSRLPAQATASLGPDATGVGWVYEYALVDRSGTLDLSQLRALQDWFLKYELKALPNVAEVGTIGGMVRQYQIVLDPDRLRAYNIPHSRVIEAVQRANQETGGAVVELGEAEYMVRATGYLRTLDDFRHIPLVTTAAGVPVRLADVARVQLGPEMRRGIAELDGEGEVTGGVIVMRSGKNALETIEAVKTKLQALKASLPPGVEIVPTYDRSGLILRLECE